VPATTPAGPATSCSPSVLRASLVSSQGAAGTGIYNFGVVNSGPSACPVGRYFGVANSQSGSYAYCGGSNGVRVRPVRAG